MLVEGVLGDPQLTVGGTTIQRSIVLTCLSFFAGAVLYRASIWIWLLLFVAAGILLFVCPKGWRATAALLLAAMITAGCYTAVRWRWLQHPLPQLNVEEPITVSGRVSEPPDHRGSQLHLMLDAASLSQGVVRPWQGHLSVIVGDRPHAGETTSIILPAVDAGDWVEITGRLRTFGPARNPGEVNWEEAMARRGIAGTLWASGDNVSLLAQGRPALFWRWAWASRRYAEGVFAKSIAVPYDDLLTGLVLGVGDQLPEDWVVQFQAAGVLHLLAVSGGNVAFVIGLLLLVLRRLPIALWAENTCLLLAIGYFVMVTGADPSVVRAGVMAGMVIVARWLLRATDFASIVALTALAMVVHNPLVLYEAGFQLSFAATLGIALWVKPISSLLTRLPQWLRLSLAVTLAAQLGVLPLSIYYFSQISLIAPLANLLIGALVAPVSFLAMVLLLCGGAWPALASLLGLLITVLLKFMTTLAGWLAQVPHATLNLPFVGGLGVILAYICLGWLSLPSAWVRWQVKVSSGLVIGASLLVIWWHPWPYPLQVTFLDVGQGDAAFIRFPNGRTLLVDGGGLRSPQPDTVGTKTVVPFLRRQGLQSLDMVLVSHPHEDHYRGLLAVTKEIPVRQFVIAPWPASMDPGYEQWVDSLAEKSILTITTAGQRIVIDPKVTFEVWAPMGSALQGSADAEVNNQSIVMRLVYGDTSLWLTGDLEADGERLMFGRLPPPQGQVALKVAHHGALNSSSERFLQALHPSVAVVSVGAGNRYGHPAPQTIVRLTTAGTAIYRTDQGGAVTLASEGSQWRVRTMIAQP